MRNHGVRLGAALLFAAVAAGLVGAGVTLLLHTVQHIAFGYRLGTFEMADEATTSLRRVIVLTIAGVVAGFGWWVIRRWPTVGPGVEEVVQHGKTMRPGGSLLDGTLQITIVGLGASLGREGAPREMSAAIAALAGRWLRLGPADMALLLASAAGAGLAAVYNVPISGTLFTTELLLGSFRPRLVIPAALTSGIATMVAWIEVPDTAVYKVDFPGGLSVALLVGAALAGPLMGVAGLGFAVLTSRARAHRPQGWRLPVWTIPTFAGLGLVAIVFPSLLGNGRGPAELAFLGERPVLIFLALGLLKPVVTAACLYSGARGGLLTPALATGAMLAGGLGVWWSQLWPGAPSGAYAVLGAAGLLAVSMRAPLTALALALELTGAPLWYLIPAGLTVLGSVITSRQLAAHGVGRSYHRAVDDDDPGGGGHHGAGPHGNATGDDSRDGRGASAPGPHSAGQLAAGQLAEQGPSNGTHAGGTDGRAGHPEDDDRTAGRPGTAGTAGPASRGSAEPGGRRYGSSSAGP